MFKLITVDQNNLEREVYPENGVYIVYELYEYKFIYSGTISRETVFIEDEIFDYDNKILTVENDKIVTKEKKRIFEDYFGYLKVNICDNEYNFEVRIQKLKVPELEAILLYLWNQDPIIFDNFFSKSTIKAKLDRENHTLNYSSKFVNIFEDYYIFFKKSYSFFKSLPHNVIRTHNSIKDYQHADISNNSIEWLINNLDEMYIDYSFKNVENSIQIHNSFGIVDKILTEEKINDFNTYENQIILGSFDFVLLQISEIKSKIKSVLSSKLYYDRDFYSINEFKIIPFLKLKDDLDRIESKIKLLQIKFKAIFIKTTSRNSYPKLTAVFSNKRHYTEAFNKIKLIRDIKINIDGELNLLNIKKLSTLYERFNLFIIVNTILERNPLSFIKENPKIEDSTFQDYYFEFSNFNISLFYDNVVSNNINKTGLQRISQGYYRPDYILRVESENGTNFIVLDSKYSNEKTVRNQHLIKCIKNYILDIGISSSPNLKIDELLLIYPGDNEETMYGSEVFNPKISIIPSKVESKNLSKIIINFFSKYLYDDSFV